MAGQASSPPPAGQAQAAQPTQPAPPPPGWSVHKDPWHGFSIAHPPAWQVVTMRGQISVREDPSGMISAWIWPFVLPAPSSARQLAAQFVNLAHAFNPSLQAWLQPGAAADSPRLTLKTRQAKHGQNLEGYFNILVNGANAVISGYEAPVQALPQRSATLTQILSTFSTAEMMARQMVVEPNERAFSIAVPQGWTWQAGVNRNHIGGKGMVQFTTARDPQGEVSASMPWYMWFFVSGMSAWNMGGYEALNYMPAAQFAQQRIAAWMGQFQQGLRIESITERLDLADVAQIDLIKAGYPRDHFEVTAAMLETTNTENGLRLRQKTRVFVQRERPAGLPFGMGSGGWSANVDIFYRAPDAEFAAWEPVLSGILDSIQMNPAWEAGERQLAQNYIQNAQSDIARRTRQISQTLSETSDILNSSYWTRQATYDKISEQRSNAMLGYQNMDAPDGEVYKVPSGYEQYWVSGLGDVYGGSWLTQPDIHWQPPTPTGI